MRTKNLLLVFSTILFLSFLTGESAIAAKQSYEKSRVAYQIPVDIKLINQDGEQILLNEYLLADKPVMLEFIFATCTTICPVMSVGFTNLQRRLGEDTEKVRLVSVSIDPEHDTPQIMKTYLERFKARKGWDFLTGSKEDIDRLMKSFDAYVTDKMDHKPLTFMRSPKEQEWIRVNGLLSGKDMMHEYALLTR